MTPVEAVQKIRAAREVAILIRKPDGDFDVVDVSETAATALKTVGPQWVLGVYRGGVRELS